MDVPCGSVVWDGPVPEVSIGSDRYDVRHRALVMGVLTSSAEVDVVLTGARRLAHEGAEVLELLPTCQGVPSDEPDRLIPLVEALVAEVRLPLAVHTASASVLAAALAAGAAIGSDVGGDQLVRVRSAGASVLVREIALPDRGSPADALGAVRRRAEAAGIPPSRVLVDAGPGTLALLRSGLARLGWPVVLSTATGEAATATQALGIALGARVLRTSDVRSARRTADVMAAILSAREERPA